MPDLGLILIVVGFLAVSFGSDWRDWWGGFGFTVLLVGSVVFLAIARIDAVLFLALVYVPPVVVGLVGGLATRAVGLWVGHSTRVRVAITGAGLIVILAIAYFLF